MPSNAPSDDEPSTPADETGEPEETGAGRSDDEPPGGYGGNPEE